MGTGLGFTREKIRSSLDESLKNISSVANRVITGEEEPNLALPNITHNLVATAFDREKSSMGYISDPGYRDFSIEVNGRVSLSGESNNQLDGLCLEIEREIASATTLNQWANDLRLESTEFEFSEDEKPIGLATLTYVGNYGKPLLVEIISYEKDTTISTIRITGTTNATGVMTQVLFDGSDSQNPITGTTILTSGSTHVAEWSGLQKNVSYLPYFYFDSDPTYVDVTEQFTWLSTTGNPDIIVLG